MWSKWGLASEPSDVGTTQKKVGEVTKKEVLVHWLACEMNTDAIFREIRALREGRGWGGGSLLSHISSPKTFPLFNLLQDAPKVLRRGEGCPNFCFLLNSYPPHPPPARLPAKIMAGSSTDIEHWIWRNYGSAREEQSNMLWIWNKDFTESPLQPKTIVGWVCLALTGMDWQWLKVDVWWICSVVPVVCLVIGRFFGGEQWCWWFGYFYRSQSWGSRGIEAQYERNNQVQFVFG